MDSAAGKKIVSASGVRKEGRRRIHIVSETYYCANTMPMGAESLPEKQI